MNFEIIPSTAWQGKPTATNAVAYLGNRNCYITDVNVKTACFCFDMATS